MFNVSVVCMYLGENVCVYLFENVRVSVWVSTCACVRAKRL